MQIDDTLAIEAVQRLTTVSTEYKDMDEMFQGVQDWKTVSDWGKQELLRRSEQMQPITPQWCLDNGAYFSAEWYWFDEEAIQVRPIAEGRWLTIVGGRMLDWSAKRIGQIENLRNALRGK